VLGHTVTDARLQRPSRQQATDRAVANYFGSAPEPAPAETNEVQLAGVRYSYPGMLPPFSPPLPGTAPPIPPELIPKMPEWWKILPGLLGLPGLIYERSRSGGGGDGSRRRRGNDDDDECDRRFGEETDRCYDRYDEYAHPGFLSGCKERAVNRWRLCIGNKAHATSGRAFGVGPEGRGNLAQLWSMRIRND